MIVYLDIILILNFVIDYFILQLTGKFQQMESKKSKLSIAALAGALYSLIFFVPQFSFFHVFISKFLLSLLMIWISFGYGHFVRFVRALAAFYFVSFVLGGGVLAFQNLFPMNHEIINGIYVSRSSSPLLIYFFVIIGFFMVFIFSSKTQISIRKKKDLQTQLLQFEIYIFDFKFEGKGLLDTGNRLYDPISRKPVLILEALNASFLPSVFTEVYKEGQLQLEDFEEVTKELEPKWLSRLQIIPFRTVSKEMEFILALRPDKVVIHSDENRQIEQTKVLIGLNYSRLSNENAYQAIIHPELLIS